MTTVFERTIGSIRFVESAGLVASALAGGLLAEVIPLRATYFVTVPFIVVSSLAMLRSGAGAPSRGGVCPVGPTDRRDLEVWWSGARCARSSPCW